MSCFQCHQLSYPQHTQENISQNTTKKYQLEGSWGGLAKTKKENERKQEYLQPLENSSS